MRPNQFEWRLPSPLMVYYFILILASVCCTLTRGRIRMAMESQTPNLSQDPSVEECRKLSSWSRWVQLDWVHLIHWVRTAHSCHVLVSREKTQWDRERSSTVTKTSKTVYEGIGKDSWLSAVSKMWLIYLLSVIRTGVASRKSFPVNIWRHFVRFHSAVGRLSVQIFLCFVEHHEFTIGASCIH